MIRDVEAERRGLLVRVLNGIWVGFVGLLVAIIAIAAALKKG